MFWINLIFRNSFITLKNNWILAKIRTMRNCKSILSTSEKILETVVQETVVQETVGVD